MNQMPSAKPVKKRLASDSSGSGKPPAKRKTLVPLYIPDRKTCPGSVFVCGQGDVGQLGLGPDVQERMRPALVPDMDNIVDICAGGMHSVCLTKDGKLMTFGCNDEGALGRVTKTEGSDEDSESTPGVVELPDEAVQISAGDSHTAALLRDGRVFIWGTFRDSHGTMGLKNGTEKSSVPVELTPGVVYTQIASGSDHLALLTEKGTVYTLGCAEQGQLGRVSVRMCDRNASRSGTAPLLTPKPLNFRKVITNIWTGPYCTFAKVRDTEMVYVTGLNNYGQIGLKTELKLATYFLEQSVVFTKENNKSWSLVAAGPHHSLAVDNKGRCYALGRKEYGRLGLGDVQDDARELTVITTLENKKCVSISCGVTSSFAVIDDGSVYSWGMNAGGELGTGSEDDQIVPALVKSKSMLNHKVVLVSGGGQHTIFLGVANNA